MFLLRWLGDWSATDMAFKTFPLTVVGVELITPTILALRFEREDGEPFEYTAGQFINIHFEVDEQPVHRSYSIASPPGSGEIEVAISPVKGGRATELLFNLKVGDTINASGPYGRFVLRDDEPCRYILAATGTGVTPYRAMLPALKELLGKGFTIDILLGIWRREEALYAQDFIDFCNDNNGAVFHACYSREMPEEPAVHESEGYVQIHIAALDPRPETDIVYLCGNPDMIDEAMEMLKAREFPTRQLRREKYLPAKA
ncbi:MAG: ferredoxin--NADP reductase [Gammaproteobacteria bacterium]|nr:ferredoxin--NADP reductase [Gammaproteobacteria bacterium]NNM19685.1 ferredoxin--NADP reductase [Gammaproteobacteria bacterium]